MILRQLHSLLPLCKHICLGFSLRHVVINSSPPPIFLWSGFSNRPDEAQGVNLKSIEEASGIG